MSILLFIEAVIGGSFLGSLLLALNKELHPERTGLINRWHYFLWYFCVPRFIFPTLVILILVLAGILKL
jgi:hypothetical protein